MLAILRISRVLKKMTINDDGNTDFLLYKSKIFKFLFSRTFANLPVLFRPSRARQRDFQKITGIRYKIILFLYFVDSNFFLLWCFSTLVSRADCLACFWCLCAPTQPNKNKFLITRLLQNLMAILRNNAIMWIKFARTDSLLKHEEHWFWRTRVESHCVLEHTG